MKTHLPFRKKITSIFITGSAILLLFYTLVVESVVHYTEELNSQQRLNIVAPHHLKSHNTNEKEQVIEVDPLISTYSHYHLLPYYIQHEISASWQGTISFITDSEEEYTVFSQSNSTGRNVYAVEYTTHVEWNEIDFLLLEIALFIFGLLLFIITAAFITNMAKRIAQPFTDLASQLHQEIDEQLSPIHVGGELSKELVHTLTGINHFRTRIKAALSREQSFTRYVSHELRTPMTVIKGSLSLLRRHKNPVVEKQVQRINAALGDMEELTKTFLLLARDDESGQANTIVDKEFLLKINKGIESRTLSNNVGYSFYIPKPITLNAEPVLVNSLISNLLFNAVNCSIDGHVHLQVDEHQISVIDNGIGLNKKARGYDGFGIGLNVVKDICRKYHWKFSLTNNNNQGCTALIIID